eukprot:TRINITY_DN9940_c0_g1_i1.p1 TRINITY_DN9940_c0_g1~~TRINITY_DN9940_c0_g1_i1.p1  ORF type:complete len:196 (-),score=32.70 TRINITY_DN9940_c0_g1_i1:404-991(-)
MATTDMCVYVFDTLMSHFHHTPVDPPVFPNQAFPLFVTFHKESTRGEDHELRGCKGTFSPRQIHSGLAEFSLISALKDTRFPPVTPAEVPKLQCSVSLLTDFEERDDIHDWEIGTHGIIIDFYHGGRSLSATYLPEVAPEQEWNKHQTLASLVRKAGYQGHTSDAVLRTLGLKLTRYQSSQSKLSFKEYKKLKGL